MPRSDTPADRRVPTPPCRAPATARRSAPRSSRTSTSSRRSSGSSSEAIFERTWQLAGHVSDLAEPGSYLTTDVVDQPVLVVRDHDGEIRAFRNVCRHRGSRLLAGSGSCGKAIRCLYHGWTYRLDGRLIGVPEGRESPTSTSPASACTRSAPRCSAA